MKEVVLIFRKPFPRQFSIEYLFYSISSFLQQEDVPIKNFQLARYSKGLLNRSLNLISLSTYKNKIIHITGDVHYAILGAWFSKRILTIHDFGFMHNKNFLARNIYWLFWIYLPVKFAHQVTVISENTKRELLSYVSVDENKVSVIGDFIDDIYQPRAEAAQATTPRLLQIGTTFNKNIERLLEAVKDIDCTMVIIGKLTSELLKILEAYHIRYENKYDLSIEDLYVEYTKCDLLCYVSTLEGFGMPILEAQATGVPVITSNCSSMPEVASQNSAVLVDPFNVEDIKKGIQSILSNELLQKTLIRNGFDNVKRYSKATIANAYLNLYHNI